MLLKWTRIRFYFESDLCCVFGYNFCLFQPETKAAKQSPPSSNITSTSTHKTAYKQNPLKRQHKPSNITRTHTHTHEIPTDYINTAPNDGLTHLQQNTKIIQVGRLPLCWLDGVYCVLCTRSTCQGPKCIFQGGAYGKARQTLQTQKYEKKTKRFSKDKISKLCLVDNCFKKSEPGFGDIFLGKICLFGGKNLQKIFSPQVGIIFSQEIVLGDFLETFFIRKNLQKIF